MKKVIIVIAFILLGIGTVNADLSDGFFCLIRKDEVIISLKQTTGYYKCKDTIASLEHLIISTAKDLIKIQNYISNGRDIDYRKTIQPQKIALLDKLQASRSMIRTNMKLLNLHLFKNLFIILSSRLLLTKLVSKNL